jgi:hypothetical protein
MSLVGCYVALSKPLAAVLPVFLLAWMRFGIGGLAMLHWLKKPVDEPPLTPQTKRLLFLESFLGNFLFTICMIYGVSLTDAVSAGVTMASIPAAVALMGWAFLRERVSPRTWAAVVCAVGGVALFSLSKPEHIAQAGQALGAKNTQNMAWLGQLLLVGAVICEAAYTVIGKKLTGSLGPKRKRCVGRRAAAGRISDCHATGGVCHCPGQRVAGHPALTRCNACGPKEPGGLTRDSRAAHGLVRVLGPRPFMWTAPAHSPQSRLHRRTANPQGAPTRPGAGPPHRAGPRCAFRSATASAPRHGSQQQRH